MDKKRIILAVTGASGAPYAAELAGELGHRDDIELHLVISAAARRVMALESDDAPGTLEAMAHAVHHPDDIAAPPASGSWRHQGMIICPCSMATLAAVATGVGDSLIHRAADVTLKERRRLVLVTRETPLSAIHLQNMLAADRAGAVVMPASPGFYHRPQTIKDLTAHLAGRVLDQLDIPHALHARWGE
ncbi:UbiX family flavin prenyltransferase [Pseudodesulfovibrio sp. F-1]|uniref:Flavin prenyltransferase UbiX n=1 Tax=Pseudodesulfovibrio alkaliphilus TaxID=2661613 RepID=A0A7K1KL81_9BACT|nr:UbiX family flavin prenyltransferase [Pseudodesulfovibrio alkaliphilus]MUM76843.1 UbiX family flavin prenyltransferase [Pseudodesulfovibrio alkaliphilus]